MQLAKALPKSKVFATDLSPTAVGLARKRATPEVCNNVSAQVADAQDLWSFRDKSFAAVTCSYGLMYFPNYRKALKEAHRVLQSDGWYAATVWASADQLQLAQVSLSLRDCS